MKLLYKYFSQMANVLTSKDFSLRDYAILTQEYVL